MTTCQRLAKLLLSRWLCEEPASAYLSFTSDASSITFAFGYAAPGVYNESDSVELQLFPTQPELLAALGDAADWCTFYSGPDRRYTTVGLPPSRAFRARVRAVNAAGRCGAWSPELLVSTLALPVRCGGVGRGYTWGALVRETFSRHQPHLTRIFSSRYIRPNT